MVYCHIHLGEPWKIFNKAVYDPVRDTCRINFGKKITLYPLREEHAVRGIGIVRRRVEKWLDTKSEKRRLEKEDVQEVKSREVEVVRVEPGKPVVEIEEEPVESVVFEMEKYEGEVPRVELKKMEVDAVVEKKEANVVDAAEIKVVRVAEEEVVASCLQGKEGPGQRENPFHARCMIEGKNM